MDLNPIIVIVSVWFVCGVLNTIWLRHNPDVIASEFNAGLIVLAPLASFFIAIGMIYIGFSRLVKAAAAAIDSRR
jgi:hypothetical protein